MTPLQLGDLKPTLEKELMPHWHPSSRNDMKLQLGEFVGKCHQNLKLDYELKLEPCIGAPVPDNDGDVDMRSPSDAGGK